MCGDDKGNIYYRRQQLQALTEVGKPTLVEQDSDWISGHKDRSNMGLLAFANVIGLPEPLTVSIDRSGEVKVWYVKQ